MNYVQLMPKLGTVKQAPTLPTFPDQKDSKQAYTPVNTDTGKKKKYYWRPDLENVNASVDSLTWMNTKRDPDGNVMSDAQYNKSMKNFELWYTEVVTEMIKQHREQENKALLG
jgi:beta-lactamase class D